jgi:hypothetical protein
MATCPGAENPSTRNPSSVKNSGCTLATAKTLGGRCPSNSGPNCPSAIAGSARTRTRRLGTQPPGNPPGCRYRAGRPLAQALTNGTYRRVPKPERALGPGFLDILESGGQRPPRRRCPGDRRPVAQCATGAHPTAIASTMELMSKSDFTATPRRDDDGTQQKRRVLRPVRRRD